MRADRRDDFHGLRCHETPAASNLARVTASADSMPAPIALKWRNGRRIIFYCPESLAMTRAARAECAE